MTEKNETAARAFGLQRVYLKDASFESPLAPEVFRGEWKPALNVNIATRARGAGEKRTPEHTGGLGGGAVPFRMSWGKMGVQTR